jgi:hypothetical protein
MALKFPRTSTSRTTLQQQIRPQQTSLTRNKQWKTQKKKSTPQMKKSEEHQQIGLNH